MVVGVHSKQRSAIYRASAVAAAIAQSATQAVLRRNEPRDGISVPAAAPVIRGAWASTGWRGTSKTGLVAKNVRPAIFAAVGRQEARPI